MYFKHFFSVEEVLERLDAVTADQVQTMAQKLFVSERIAVTLLGRLDGLEAEAVKAGLLEVLSKISVRAELRLLQADWR
jgi:hypothetical protein